jgi:DNA-binding response OmpR family regulator
MRLLVVEDSPDLLVTLTEALQEHYAVDAVSTGKEALYLAGVNNYDVIVMDIGLPDTDGITVCRQLRDQGLKMPILILTGRAAVEDKVTALDGGADDYLTKPFQLPELFARLRALLRRPQQQEAGIVLTFGNLQLDLAARAAYRGGKKVELRRKEMDLLELLMRNQGKVVTRSVILEHVWNSDVNAFTNAIDVHIKHLRDQIDKPFGTKLIQTIYGAGYRLGSPKPLSRATSYNVGPAQKGGGNYGKRHGTVTR